ncbi:MAG: 16S rRNA (guanine(966)-N(2))-methyltransferase RsmD [Devosiaceae bacterium]|nr:16S rRNA (guanine(966)-N(2))-methyltransferase RsmD [Devosiaceae bacterium MH13]
MRIVGGSLKGRALKAPRSQAIRPTTDRARESLFNILAHSGDLFAEGHSLDGARVIDLFAGTGALGLEALSRGAAYALFVDQSLEGRSLIRENMLTCGVAAKARLFKRDATRLGERGSLAAFDLAFLDPPYDKGLGGKSLEALDGGDWLAPDALVVLEESKDAEIDLPAGFTMLESRAFGGSLLRFLRYSARR